MENMDSNHKSEKGVHFPEEMDRFGKDTKIGVSVTKEVITVRVGFLQHMHRYRIMFVVSESKLNASFHQSVPNLNAKLLELEDQSGGVLVGLELLAHKEKLLKEKLYFSNDKDEIEMEIVARVFGKVQGTPLLRDGVHLIGNEMEDESEQSDWQGFS